MNPPNTTNNTHLGFGKTLTMNRDEVEEDPREYEGTEAFEDKGIEAFVEEVLMLSKEKYSPQQE